MWYVYTTSDTGQIENSFVTDMLPTTFAVTLRTVFPEYKHQVIMYARFNGQPLITYGVSNAK